MHCKYLLLKIGLEYIIQLFKTWKEAETQSLLFFMLWFWYSLTTKCVFRSSWFRMHAKFSECREIGNIRSSCRPVIAWRKISSFIDFVNQVCEFFRCIDVWIVPPHFTFRAIQAMFLAWYVTIFIYLTNNPNL